MARRVAGEGSITRRKDGSYDVELSMGSREHRRRWRATVKDREDAIDRLELFRRQAGVAGPPDPDNQTVAQFLRWWLETELPARVADPTDRLVQTTVDGYRSKIERYLIPALGYHRLRKLGPQHVKGLMRSMALTTSRLGKPLSNRTIQYAVQVLSSALSSAVEYELVDRNVAKLVTAPGVERSKPPVLSADHAQALLRAVRRAGEDQRRSRLVDPVTVEALFLAPLSIGLRPGEALGLAWDALDLDDGVIVVRRNLVRHSGGWWLNDVKTHRQRTVPLPAPAVDALRAQRRRQLELRLAAGPDWQPELVRDGAGVDHGADLVFTQTTGRVIRDDWVTDQMTRLCEQAGIPRLTPHQFMRHGGATLMLAQGVKLEVIKEILGHSSVQVTEIYSHVLDEAKRDAADRMGAVFRL